MLIPMWRFSVLSMLEQVSAGAITVKVIDDLVNGPSLTPSFKSDLIEFLL